MTIAILGNGPTAHINGPLIAAAPDLLRISAEKDAMIVQLRHNINAIYDEKDAVIIERNAEIARLREDGGQWAAIAADRDIEIAKRGVEIARLREAAIEHEEDCSCLPEDQGVTETVGTLRTEIARLRAERDKALDDLRNCDTTLALVEDDNQRLREALENIIKHMEYLSPDAVRVSGVVAIARAALEGTDG